MSGRATHGHTRGLAGTKRGSPTYLSWLAMRARCLNPNSSKYPRYGGRGIKVYAQWRESFENFLADMGERPPGTTLDRRENDGDYEPGNCRLATSEVQAENCDRSRKGWKRNRTHCSHWHPYDEQNTRLTADGFRQCRV